MSGSRRGCHFRESRGFFPFFHASVKTAAWFTRGWYNARLRAYT